jgi:hypothetical protein
MAPRITQYMIHDNGGRPFIVDDTKSEKNAVVYKTKYIEEGDTYEKTTKVLTTSYERIFVGDNLMKDPHYEEVGWARGNSLLLQISEKKYVHVGDCVFSFEPVDEDVILKYYSPVGNNDVPYPYAVGKKYVYFMWDKSYYPVEFFDLKKDATTQMIRYTIMPPREKGHDYMEMRKEFEKLGKKLKLKMIHKRYF